ncbi:MAG: UDP-2,4-diacetamido-2,4,6-trideoxy-beta-L-altropyranose hydrolase [Candidatus Sulfotelmatobacter sp.]
MAKQPATLIRADASVAIGTGHVMRCLALAQAWQDAGGEATLVAAELPDSLLARLTVNKVSILQIDATPGSSDDARSLISHASRLKPDWIVIDGDRFGGDFLQLIQESGPRVLLVDDYADRTAFPVDMIVNPNFGAEPDVYRSKGFAAPALSGPRHALLRREFQNPLPRKVRERGKRILVTLGGSDPENLTPQIATALAACPDLQITVVAGGAYSNKSELADKLGCGMKLVFDSQEMPRLMMEADIAITIAGGTLWELLSLGCAVLSYARTTGGAYLVTCLAKQSMLVDMGEISHFDAMKIVPAIREIAESISTRQRMALRGQELVDGAGAKRVVEMLREMGGR